jgi:hypothetical protein
MASRLKKEFIRLLERDGEFRYAVAGYLGLADISKSLGWRRPKPGPRRGLQRHRQGLKRGLQGWKRRSRGLQKHRQGLKRE